METALPAGRGRIRADVTSRKFGRRRAGGARGGHAVLVSDQVALAEVVVRNQLGWVVPLETAAIRAGLEQSLAGSSARDTYRRRVFVQGHYSWIANAAAIERLYREIVEGHTGRRKTRRLHPPSPRS